MAEWKHAQLLREHAHQPEDVEIQRVRRRAMERVSRRRRVPGWALACVATAAAALALLWLAAPTERAPQALSSAGDWTRTQARPGVRLAFQGQGQVASPSVVSWEQGELKVDVEPDRGIQFRVETAEASIRVVGTVFAVERSSLGTSVTVDRGEVEVTCQDEPAQDVIAGQAWLCLRSPAAALHWADSHPERAAEELLRVLDRGLARSQATDPVHGELEVLRIQTLAASGQQKQALEAAERRLGRGADHRIQEVRQIAAKAAMATGGCAASLPHLEALASAGDGAAMVLQADCIREQRPDQARALLERALELAPPPGQAGAIRRRLDTLDAGAAE
jgi:hypothetical protein